MAKSSEDLEREAREAVMKGVTVVVWICAVSLMIAGPWWWAYEYSQYKELVAQYHNRPRTSYVPKPGDSPVAKRIERIMQRVDSALAWEVQVTAPKRLQERAIEGVLLFLVGLVLVLFLTREYWQCSVLGSHHSHGVIMTECVKTDERSDEMRPVPVASLDVHCPNCQHYFQRPVGLAGHQERCPECKSVFVIPRITAPACGEESEARHTSLNKHSGPESAV